MKHRILCLAFALLLWASVEAQVRKIPAAVTTALKSKFPNAGEVSWKDQLANFEASFTMNGEQYKASFDGKGNWKKTERSTNWQALPEAVKTTVQNSKYGSWERGSVAEVEDHEDGKYYRVFVEKNKVQKKFLKLGAEGKMLDD